MKTLNLNTLFLIIATIVVLGGGYWYFFSGNVTQPPLSTGTAGASSGAKAQFETLIGQLEPITFDLTVLHDPRFDALVDLATLVTPEPSGRTDPFAPVPGVKSK